jgi:hypothetical protein
MPGLGARLIAYGFLGAFAFVGALFIVIAVNATVQRALFIHSALRAEGTVIELQPVHSTRHDAGTVVPVFRFTGNDGRIHLARSEVSVGASVYRVHDRVDVLYRPDQPQRACIDRFSILWRPSLIFGIVGAAFASVGALALRGIVRVRRQVAEAASGMGA